MCIRCAYYSTCKGAVRETLIAYPTAQYICGLSGGGLSLPDFASVAVFDRMIALYSPVAN